jgi:hypothetical protein
MNDPSATGEYTTSIEALMRALKLGNNYAKELAAARSMSMKVASPYTISIRVYKAN